MTEKPTYEELEQRIRRANLKEKETLLQKIQQSEKRFEDIVELLPGAIVELDVNLMVTYVNQTGLDLFGYANQDIQRGLNVLDLLYSDDREKAVQRIAKYHEEKRVSPTEYRVIRKDGSDIPVLFKAVPILQAGEITGFRAVITDIRRLKQAEAALRDSEEKYRSLVNTSTEGIQLTDLDGKIIFSNPAHHKIQGYAEGDLIGKFVWDMASEQSEKTRTEEYYKMLIKDQPQPEPFFSTDRTNDGRLIHTQVNWDYIRDSEGKLAGIISTISDITERKKAEEKIKANLKEKETLLQEIHHRVKNNMAIVSSLLSAQARKAKDHHVKAVLQDSQARIDAMSTIHETLYQSENLSSINMNSYLSRLASMIIQNYGADSRPDITVEIKNIVMGVKQASPIGLIVNELLTNSLKYAFPDEQKGEINIKLQQKKGQLELKYSDNGIGLPYDFDWRASKSLGLHLIKLLGEGQLGGTVRYHRDQGSCFVISFKLDDDDSDSNL